MVSQSREFSGKDGDDCRVVFSESKKSCIGSARLGCQSSERDLGKLLCVAAGVFGRIGRMHFPSFLRFLIRLISGV